MGYSRLTRRRFMQTGLCCAVLATGWAVQVSRRSGAAASQTWVRPPGALPASDFYGACIRCGLCVDACPYDTLSLFDLVGRDAGTPYFVAREVPCEMCADIPCVRACPTGALDPALKDIRAAQMGLAVLSHPELCNSVTGAAYCDSCARACPVGADAITIESGRTALGGFFTPVVNPDACTGCGRCEHACVAHPAAIRIQPTPDTL